MFSFVVALQLQTADVEPGGVETAPACPPQSPDAGCRGDETAPALQLQTADVEPGGVETAPACPPQSPDAGCRGDETAPASSVDIGLFYGRKRKLPVGLLNKEKGTIRKKRNISVPARYRPTD